jgi:hypothetical protein
MQELSKASYTKMGWIQEGILRKNSLDTAKERHEGNVKAASRVGKAAVATGVALAGETAWAVLGWSAWYVSITASIIVLISFITCMVSWNRIRENAGLNGGTTGKSFSEYRTAQQRYDMWVQTDAMDDAEFKEARK